MTGKQSGMHASYDSKGRAKYCGCSSFWDDNPDVSVYVAHDHTTGERLTLAQISARKEVSTV